jgi:hypothetical protein
MAYVALKVELPCRTKFVEGIPKLFRLQLE